MDTLNHHILSKQCTWKYINYMALNLTGTKKLAAINLISKIEFLGQLVEKENERMRFGRNEN